MRTKLGSAIRNARTAAGLTQKQLGQRIGVEGHAVHRWEKNESAPTQRHQRELVSAIQVRNPAAAATLLAAFSPEQRKATPEAAAQAAPTAISQSDALALAVFRLADELDLPTRRLRRPLARFLVRLREAGLTLETTQQQVDSWIESEQ